MNRLQKKCMAVSVGIHGVLLCVLIFGPAFKRAPDRPKREIQLHLLSSAAIEAALNASKPVQEPVVIASQAVTPVPEVVVKEPPPEPKPEPVKPKPEPKPEPKRVDPKPEPKPVKKVETPKPPKVEKPAVKKPTPKPKPEIKINFNTTKIKTDPNRAKREAERREREKAAAAERARQRELQRSLQSLGSDLSRRTDIHSSISGGSALGNYRLFVKSAYDRAWVEPTEGGTGRAVSRVKVVVNLDGSIASASLVAASGVGRLDRSVQDALRRVKRINRRPPEGTTTEDRTFYINFTLSDGV